MVAGFQSDVEGCPAGLFACLVQGIDFGMGTAEALVVATTDDLLVLDNDGAHKWVGRGKPRSLSCQLKRHLHVKSVFHYGSAH